MYKNSKPVLDIKSYPTIKYLYDIGVDLSSTPDRVRNVICKCLSEYELRCYHHDIMKRPYNLYDAEGVKRDIFRHLMAEVEEIKSHDCEIVSERKYKQIQKESRLMNTLVPLCVIGVIMAVIVLVSVIDMYISVKGGF